MVTTRGRGELEKIKSICLQKTPFFTKKIEILVIPNKIGLLSSFRQLVSEISTWTIMG